MSEKKLSEEQMERIRKLKEQWSEEARVLFEESNTKQNKTVLDGNLRSQAALERKYNDLIRKVMEE